MPNMQDIYGIIIWKDQVIIDQFESHDKEECIKWLNNTNYPAMHSNGECGIEVDLNGEILDYITETELGFRVFKD